MYIDEIISKVPLYIHYAVPGTTFNSTFNSEKHITVLITPSIIQPMSRMQCIASGT